MINREKWRHIQQLQKGKHLMSKLHKPIEDFIVYLLYDLEFIGADHISIITYILAFIVVYFFLQAKVCYALVLALIVGILDGVDGKIARLRGKKTYIGKIEHSFDMLYEQIIYVSWIYYVYTTIPTISVILIGIIFLVSDAFTRHVYMQFKIATGKNLLLMSKLDRKIAKIDGRRNVWFIYMLIGVVIQPIWGLILMLIHSLLTSIVYVVRAIQHLRGIDIREGMEKWQEMIYKS